MARSNCEDLKAERINGDDAEAAFLLLQGKLVGEPVAQYGPVGNELPGREIAQTLTDYQRTGFGGWLWLDDAPAPAQGRDLARIDAAALSYLATRWKMAAFACRRCSDGTRKA